MECPKRVGDLYCQILTYSKSDDSGVFVVQRGENVVRIWADIGWKREERKSWKVEPDGNRCFPEWKCSEWIEQNDRMFFNLFCRKLQNYFSWLNELCQSSSVLHTYRRRRCCCRFLKLSFKNLPTFFFCHSYKSQVLFLLLTLITLGKAIKRHLSH